VAFLIYEDYVVGLGKASRMNGFEFSIYSEETTIGRYNWDIEEYFVRE